jgi:hypothetical protein
MHQINACQLNGGLGALLITGTLKSGVQATAGGHSNVKPFRYERGVVSGFMITP